MSARAILFLRSGKGGRGFMCGIAGMLAERPDADVRNRVRALTGALRHRGPDGDGFAWWGTAIGFGHRRLSIVDPAGGHQPMANEDASLWVTYNGEIYNHHDIRRDLEARGHRFRTRADTEVLVHGWEEWGEGLLPRLNGIYAFAVYDGRSTDAPELWLARDPVGAKPLYLGRRGGSWWFASELAAARAVDLIDGALRPGALAEYLVYRFIPSPGTPYRDVWKVPPGHAVRLEPAATAEPAFRRFHPDFAPAVLPGNAGEWMEAITGGLGAAVRRQLMSDVPVGSLLSGGVDSTVVTSFMCEGLPEPPQAFAIGFPGPGGELDAARRAATALETPLREMEVSEEDYRSAWPAHAASFGEPVANSGALLLAMLCRVVGWTHKVVLTGQGADEPLGGYPRHAAERWYRAVRLLRPLLTPLPEGLVASDRLDRMRRFAARPEEADRFAELLAVFAPAEARRLTRDSPPAGALAAPVRYWLPADLNGDSLNRLLYVDARLSLADDLLTVADHTAMASSVELRVPFLDLPLLALLERMPSRYKVSSLGQRKWLYRRAVAPLLPPAVRRATTGWRARMGSKQGFSTPMERWFTDWVHGKAERELLGRKARLPDVLHPEPVRALLADVRDRQAPRGRQLLALYMLEAWLQGAPQGAGAT